MEVTTGIVVDGKVVVEGEELPEGRKVAIALLEPDDGVYSPTPGEAEALRQSAQDGDDGNRVDALDHLRQLRREASE